MQERELEIVGGSLYYEQVHNRIVITRFQGWGSEVQIPGVIEKLPVCTIAKKAFLSKKNLRKVSLPDTIEDVGDWAFAYCDNLEQVQLPGHAVQFGRAVFLDCGKLKCLRVGHLHADTIAVLLAAAVTTMQAPYLLDLEETGSNEWFAKWDARMLEILNRPDTEGFSRQVLCGEEDYGSTDMNAYVNSKRKGKVRLLLLRQLYDQNLSEELRNISVKYLREHTKGCPSEETWQVILQEHGNDREYYQLFAELDCLTEDNFEDVISDIGEEYPEMKAYFMRYKGERIGYTDFFEALEL